MKKIVCSIFLFAAFLVGCGTPQFTTSDSESEYQRITAEEAKTMMEKEDSYLLLDVREQGEYDEGHIPNAVLFPVGTIDEESAAEVIPEKETLLLVYCRSGNRSKTASQALAELGYTQVYEFGGIRDWLYEIEASIE